MNSEMEITIAFLFKRSGKTELKDSEIYLPLSIELGWFSTKESHEFVRHAIKQNLLIKKGDLLTPSFDVEKIKIPIGFFPSKKAFKEEKIDLKEEKKNVLDTIVFRISEKSNQDSKNILEEIKRAELEKNILPEVAALLVAKEQKINIEDSYEMVENKIFRENEE